MTGINDFLTSSDEETSSSTRPEPSFRDTLSIQNEGEFLATIAEKWCNTLPIPNRSGGDEVCAGSLQDFPEMLGRFREPMESDGLFVSSSGASSSKAPYRPGK